MRYLLAILIALLLAAPAPAGQNEFATILNAVVVDPASPQTITIYNAGATRGYLWVTTASEVGTASLAVTVTMNDDQGNSIAAATTSTPITTNTTTALLIGARQSVGDSVLSECCFPLGRAITVSYVVTGADSSFRVDSSMEFLAN